MKEGRDILREAGEARRHGEAAILATVVRVAGSTYRRPGARMLIRPFGPTAGLISGGCLEADLVQRAHEVIESGASRTVVYDMRSPDDIVWGLGLGCEGEVRVLLEPLTASNLPGALATVERAITVRQAGAVATVFDGFGPEAPRLGSSLAMSGADGPPAGDLGGSAFGGLALTSIRSALAERRSRSVDWSLAASRATALVEYVPPPIRLMIFGAGQDAVSLVAMAQQLGWDVEVFDHRPEAVVPVRFPGALSVRLIEQGALAGAVLLFDERTAAVLMTHHFLRDLEILEVAVASELPYIGLLGPQRRARKLRDQLVLRGSWDDERSDRIHAPLGLDLGAESPEEIALAAVAEIQARFVGRAGGSLRLRDAPLHDWP